MTRAMDGLGRAGGRISLHIVKKLAWALAFLAAVASLLPSPFGAVRADGASTPLVEGSHAAAATVGLLTRACANCHSHQTVWPWYSHIAPASWLLERDVQEARKFMNLSRWPEYGPEGQRQLLALSASDVRTGTMPPARYLVLHPEAQLSGTEKDALVNWFGEESKRLVAPGNCE